MGGGGAEYEVLRQAIQSSKESVCPLAQAQYLLRRTTDIANICCVGQLGKSSQPTIFHNK